MKINFGEILGNFRYYFGGIKGNCWKIAVNLEKIWKNWEKFCNNFQEILISYSAEVLKKIRIFRNFSKFQKFWEISWDICSDVQDYQFLRCIISAGTRSHTVGFADN